MERFDPATTALVLVDLQNDFLHPEGAYGRAGQGAGGDRRAAGPAGAAGRGGARGRGVDRLDAFHAGAGQGRRAPDLAAPAPAAAVPGARRLRCPAAGGTRWSTTLPPRGLRGREGRVLGLLHEPAGIRAAPRRHRDAGLRRHRDEWRRRLDAARRACPRLSPASCCRMAAPPSGREVHETAIADLSTVATVATCAEALAWVRGS